MSVQKRIVRQSEAWQAAIAREREMSRQLAAAAQREVEEMILGIRPVL